MNRNSKAMIAAESVIMAGIISFAGWSTMQITEIRLTLAKGLDQEYTAARLTELESDAALLSKKVDGIICMLQYPSTDTQSRLRCLQQELYQNRLQEHKNDPSSY